MAIPKFTEIMTPMLEWLQDGEMKHYKDFNPFIVDKLKISEEDQATLLKSGQSLFENRYSWARFYLKNSGLIDVPQRGMVKITEDGLKSYKSGEVIKTIKDLEKYPKYLERKVDWSKKEKVDESSQSVTVSEYSPEELIETNVKNLNQLLAEELLDRVKTISPSDFEYLVVKLLTTMGYGGSLKDAGVVIGKSGDGGIDGIISEDRLGLSKIYIQAKRWEGSVGDVEIGRFLGSLSSRGATKGVFITTSQYTKQAKETIDRNRSSMEIVLIDGSQLAELMIEYNLGVSIVANYLVKKVDSDFFE